MFKFGRRTKSVEGNGRLGISVSSDGFSLCHVVREEDGTPKLALSRSVSGLSTEERQAALSELVAESKLEDVPCVVVLEREFYSLRLVDKPSVEEDEVAGSLVWFIKDLIDFDPSDAVIDYTDFPVDASRGRDAKIFVAAARKSAVTEATELLSHCGLTLDAVDVPEFAMRNIAGLLPTQVAGTLLLDLGLKDGLLTICHDDMLYFTRPISSGTAQIDDAIGHEIAFDDSDGELSHQVRGLLDDLLLEVQRSLDYYESELGKAPASRLIIGPSTSEIGPYLPYLTEQLRPVAVSQIDLNTAVACEEPMSNELQSHSLLALGGALRNDAEQQIDLGKTQNVLAAYTTLPLEWVVKVCAGMIAVLMTIYGLGTLKNHQLSEQLDASSAQHDRILRDLGALETQIAENSGAGETFDPLAELRRERDGTAMTLRNLDMMGADRRVGFSKYFVGFASQIVENVWLSRIEVLDGGASLSIHGNTLSAKGVPQLLRKLRGEETFSGKTFSLFRLSAAEAPGVLSFALESKPAEVKAK